MKSIKPIFTVIRWLSVFAIIAVLGMGFVMPVSISQAFIVNPVLLVILMGTFVYCGIKLDAIMPMAEIEQCSTLHKWQAVTV